MTDEYPDRRMFLSEGSNYYQIMSFTQNRTDSSIYISSPDFSKIKWLSFSSINGEPQLIKTDSPGDGKLSIHGSGMTKIEPNLHDLVVHGSYLYNAQSNSAVVRHLFTIQLAEPKFTPVSPVFNRKSDYVIKTKIFSPMKIIFFAIPRINNLSIEFQISFDIDDLEEIPPDSGGGSLDLILHTVFWFAYRTKYMQEWPPNPHVCYYDGYLVPVLIGIGERQFRAELRSPSYKLSSAHLVIKM